MPRTFIAELFFPYDWTRTALGVLHKYPNPYATHVVSMDTISQEYDEPSGRVRLERVLGVRQGAPRWVVKLLNLSEDTYVREIMIVDRSAQSIEMTSTNLTLSEYLLVKEYITYKPSAASSTPNSTTFRQVASIESSREAFGTGILAKAGRKLEDSSYDRFGSNAHKGRDGLMAVLKGMWGEPAATAGAVA